MHQISRLTSFCGLVVASAFLLQACAPNESPDGIRQVSSRVWKGWRVDCHQDSAFGTGHEVYVFKPATADEMAAPASSDWSDPVATDSAAGKDLLWINDSGWRCNGKGFYARRGADGELAPATASFAYEKGESRHPEERRAWRGIAVDCYADTGFSSRGRGLYQFGELAKGEAANLSSSGLGEPRPAGKIDGRPLFWVPDHSWDCRGRGFYVARSAEGRYEPVGVGYSYTVGKSSHGATAIIEHGGFSAEDGKAVARNTSFR